LDGAVRRWHRHPGAPACGRGQKGGRALAQVREDEALGYSRGGYSTKVHLKAEGGGNPLAVVLTPGQRHELTVAERLLRLGAIRRRGRGRPRVRAARAVGDKGYSSRRLRQHLRCRGVRHTIPHKTNEQGGGPFDRALYRLRHKVENLINRCKQYRSLATRYDKRGDTFRTLWVIACTILWLKV
jgi:transposase